MLLSDRQTDELLKSARRIAVLGIKPDTRPAKAAFWIPKYLQSVGYEILPVPVYYPEIDEFLGKPALRSLLEVPQPIDILSVFRKAEDFTAHLSDVLTLMPRVVWFQSGTLPLDAVPVINRAGIDVVHDCIACRRAVLQPSNAPFEAQLGGVSGEPPVMPMVPLSEGVEIVDDKDQ